MPRRALPLLLAPLAPLGALRFSLARPGDYRATIRYDKSFFRSIEAVEDVHATALAMLSLEGTADGGVASGCFFADATMRLSLGKVSPADHSPHPSELSRTTRLGARGTWTLDARGWTIVSLTTSATNATCPAPSTPDDAGAGHLDLRCVGVAIAMRIQNDDETITFEAADVAFDPKIWK